MSAISGRGILVMSTTRRRVALAITAAASVASVLALAVPAQAVVPPTPSWPTAGRTPVGCAASVALGGPDNANWQYTYTDPGQPVITDTMVSGNSTNITVLPPAGAAVRFAAKASEPCSGVQAMGVYLSRNRVLITSASLTNTTADAFSSWWAWTAPTVQPDSAVGVWTVPYVMVERRYDSFVLDQDFRIVGVPSLSVTTIGTTGTWAKKPFYLVRAMTLSNTLSAAKVAKGRTVKATAVLKMATNAGYVVDASDKVVVQTKVGTGKWVSHASLTTNASGVVSYSFVLTATTQVRFVHNRVLSGKYTNAVTSAIKTVTRA
jgi:hypothetical protein